MSDYIEPREKSDIEQLQSDLDEIREEERRNGNGVPTPSTAMGGDGTSSTTLEKEKENMVRAARKAALESTWRASSDEERIRMHERIKAEGNLEEKQIMDDLHKKTPTARRASMEAPTIDDELKKKGPVEASIHAQLANLKARVARYENRDKESYIDELVALKASIVPTLDHASYASDLRAKSFNSIRAEYESRKDEIDAIKVQTGLADSTPEADTSLPKLPFNASASGFGRNSGSDLVSTRKIVGGAA